VSVGNKLTRHTMIGVVCVRIMGKEKIGSVFANRLVESTTVLKAVLDAPVLEPKKRGLDLQGLRSFPGFTGSPFGQRRLVLLPSTPVSPTCHVSYMDVVAASRMLGEGPPAENRGIVGVGHYGEDVRGINHSQIGLR
jgi:hypothetical protein